MEHVNFKVTFKFKLIFNLAFLAGLRQRHWQTQVHVLEDKDLLEHPEAAIAALAQFLDIPMNQLLSWDKEFVQSAIQKRKSSHWHYYLYQWHCTRASS